MNVPHTNMKRTVNGAPKKTPYSSVLNSLRDPFAVRSVGGTASTTAILRLLSGAIKSNRANSTKKIYETENACQAGPTAFDRLMMNVCIRNSDASKICLRNCLDPAPITYWFNMCRDVLVKDCYYKTTQTGPFCLGVCKDRRAKGVIDLSMCAKLTECPYDKFRWKEDPECKKGAKPLKEEPKERPHMTVTATTRGGPKPPAPVSVGLARRRSTTLDASAE